jgi:hypothetical protein
MWIGRKYRMRKLFDEFIEVHELVAPSKEREERSDQLLDAVRAIAAMPFNDDMEF